MKILCKWLASVSILAWSSIGIADDHSPAENANLPLAAQIQLCNLNDGKTMADYDRMANDYFKWSEKTTSRLRLFDIRPCLLLLTPRIRVTILSNT